MPTAPAHRPTPPLTALLAAALTAALMLTPSASPAQDARPAKKDSSARMKPKDVAVTASVTPAEAKPGDTVTYKVHARLNPGWHIYTYSKEPQGEGPRNTRFDLFDTAGLTPVGDWTADKAPIRKKEPAFPDIDAVSFFEGEVTWSLKLKVPDNAPPGPKTLRCQASYQICNAASCSFPGQWTLPDVVLTVVGGGASAEKAPADASVAKASEAEVPRPRKKDTSARLKPKQVVLTPDVSPVEARPGETVTLRVVAKLEPGWHIYDYDAVQADDAPKATQFDVFDAGGLKPLGDWKADTPPMVKQDPAFNNALVRSFEGQASWSRQFQVPAEATPGKTTVRIQAAYQVCDATSCKPPGQWTLPEVALTILPAGAASPSAASPSAAAPDPSTAAESAPTEAPAPEAAAAAEAPARVVSEVEKTARQGLIPLIITAAGAGLLALVMPCVWPMVPITVNFFIKQGQKKGKTTGLAITYCLAIIGVFTAVGVLCSVFLSATALPKLANNPWLNFAVAGLFLAFGLSLLGLFEIRLPNALLNASAKGEGRGGLVGVVFMALTLTITSFTCTFPVVGGLLVMASGGQYFYPIVGLATFATVLALPFFLLALSPGLLSKMPKSGDWMNAVKVVGGLVEIGAAFKFLNTAELSFVTPENAWIDAQVILTAWIVLAAVCGFYLLGFFRTDHDHEEAKVGPGRIMIGSGFLGLALFLAPALFGNPPRSLVWDRLVVGLLPPDVAELSAPTGVLAGSAGGSGPEQHAVFATDPDPKTAERQEKRFHGVWWGFSYEEALERARAEGKPVLIDFTGVNCANCRLMERRVLPRPEVADLLKKFVTVQLYTAPTVPINSITADQREALAEANSERQIDLTNDNTNPFYVVLSPDGKLVATTGGYREPEVFVSFLNDALGTLGGARKVAQAGTGR
jgi:thiol:disulfide interchange protein DsbD